MRTYPYPSILERFSLWDRNISWVDKMRTGSDSGVQYIMFVEVVRGSRPIHIFIIVLPESWELPTSVFVCASPFNWEILFTWRTRLNKQLDPAAPAFWKPVAADSAKTYPETTTSSPGTQLSTRSLTKMQFNVLGMRPSSDLSLSTRLVAFENGIGQSGPVSWIRMTFHGEKECIFEVYSFQKVMRADHYKYRNK